MANRPGRPTLLTPEIRGQILNLLKRGNYRQTAAHAVGIDPETFRRWMRASEEDADGVGEYAGFAAAVVMAEGEAESTVLQKLIGGLDPDPASLRWYLERKHKARWAGKERLEVSGPDGGPIEMADARAGVMGKLASLAARSGAPAVPDEPDGSGS